MQTMQERVRVCQGWQSRFLVGVCALGFWVSVADARNLRRPDYHGYRFFCGDSGSERICLPYLRSECSLSFVRGKSTLGEVQQSLLINREGSVSRVNTPGDLAGCIELASSLDALDYLRFFSSPRTIHLFDQPFLEIFPARKRKRPCVYTCLPEKTWDRLGLVEASVKEADSGFEVSRFAIERDASVIAGVRVVQIVEFVSFDGTIEIMANIPFVFAVEDIAGLMFPQYCQFHPIFWVSESR